MKLKFLWVKLSTIQAKSWPIDASSEFSKSVVQELSKSCPVLFKICAIVVKKSPELLKSCKKTKSTDWQTNQPSYWTCDG